MSSPTLTSAGRVLLPLLAVVLAYASARVASGSRARSTLGLIPRPQELERVRGHFVLTPHSRIIVDANSPQVAAIGEYLAGRLRPATGFALPVVPASSAPVEDAIWLTTLDADPDLVAEGYQLTVSGGSIVLRARQPAALFHGVQTLRQLLPAEIESTQPLSLCWRVPGVRIKDWPRFGWRGMLLDCSRHFMQKDFIKRYLDLLAYHKMNVFHWHLTDDHGWRLEIRKFPRLTAVGASRQGKNGPYIGFYTQADVREIVAYAASRHITVVPEIEMPAHALAALASYPELSCRGEPLSVGIPPDASVEAFCAGNEKTFQFIEGVLDEVVELFPSEYIHVGGDEVEMGRWRACAKCQARMTAEGLKDEHALQSYFLKRVAAYLALKNRRVIGWDEVLGGDLPAGVLIQAWRGQAQAARASQAGHDTILSPTQHWYFNAHLSVIDLAGAYAFDPLREVTPAAQKHVWGGECCLWTEYLPQEAVDGQMFPRMLGFAEAVWSAPTHRSIRDLYDRVKLHGERLQRQGVRAGPAFMVEPVP